MPTLPKPTDPVSVSDVFVAFRGKCVRCRKPASDVHEIIPRSLKSDWEVFENRVTLCRECHDWSHSRGTNFSGDALRLLREKRMREYYD